MTDTKTLDAGAPSQETGATAETPIDPNSPRERLRAWLNWLPVWFLIPFGLGPRGDGTSAGGYEGGYEGGYHGPLDSPSHLDGGFGDHGGGDIGGGGSGGF